MIAYAWWERERSTVVSGPGTVNPSAGSGVSAGTTGGNAGSQVRARVGVTLFIPRSEALLALMPNFGRRFPSGFLDVIVFGCGLSPLEGAGRECAYGGLGGAHQVTCGWMGGQVLYIARFPSVYVFQHQKEEFLGVYPPENHRGMGGLWAWMAGIRGARPSGEVFSAWMVLSLGVHSSRVTHAKRPADRPLPQQQVLGVDDIGLQSFARRLGTK